MIFSDIVIALISFFITFILTYFLTFFLIKVLTEKGLLVEDYHKQTKPKIPRPGGPAMLISIFVVEIILYFFYLDLRIISLVLVTMIAGMIGFFDDFVKFKSGIVKPILLIVASLPILFLGTYDFYLTFPIFGSVRLSIVYPLLIFLAVPIVSNATNMLDVLNGALSGFIIIVTIPIIFALFLKSDYALINSAIPLLASSLAFYLFHKFPSKIFPGDSGSLGLGAMFCALAIVGGVEFVAVIAILPAILNSFFILSSIKGFIEHRNMKSRPTSLLSDNRIRASTDLSAPSTLVRIILLDGPLSESEVVKNIFVLSAFSAILAIITALVMWWI